jgi:hypothetical protein
MGKTVKVEIPCVIELCTNDCGFLCSKCQLDIEEIPFVHVYMENRDRFGKVNRLDNVNRCYHLECAKEEFGKVIDELLVDFVASGGC